MSIPSGVLVEEIKKQGFSTFPQENEFGEICIGYGHRIMNNPDILSEYDSDLAHAIKLYDGNGFFDLKSGELVDYQKKLNNLVLSSGFSIDEEKAETLLYDDLTALFSALSKESSGFRHLLNLCGNGYFLHRTQMSTYYANLKKENSASYVNRVFRNARERKKTKEHRTAREYRETREHINANENKETREHFKQALAYNKNTKSPRFAVLPSMQSIAGSNPKKMLNTLPNASQNLLQKTLQQRLPHAGSAVPVNSMCSASRDISRTSSKNVLAHSRKNGLDYFKYAEPYSELEKDSRRIFDKQSNASNSSNTLNSSNLSSSANCSENSKTHFAEQLNAPNTSKKKNTLEKKCLYEDNLEENIWDERLLAENFDTENCETKKIDSENLAPENFDSESRDTKNCTKDKLHFYPSSSQGNKKSKKSKKPKKSKKDDWELLALPHSEHDAALVRLDVLMYMGYFIGIEKLLKLQSVLASIRLDDFMSAGGYLQSNSLGEIWGERLVILSRRMRYGIMISSTSEIIPPHLIDDVYKDIIDDDDDSDDDFYMDYMDKNLEQDMDEYIKSEYISVDDRPQEIQDEESLYFATDITDMESLYS